MKNTTATIENLRQRWHSVSVDLPEALFDDLASRHAEPQRHYHTFDHIADCFEKLDACCGADSASRQIVHSCHPAIELAIFYHDAIYDPKRSDNEMRSADLARCQLVAHLEPAALNEVERLILATAHFSDELPQSPSPTQELITDIDLSILGSDPVRYDDYARKIRREFLHAPAPAYREGRAKVLKKFLTASRLFSNPWFEDRFEKTARQNLLNELSVLDEM